MSQELTPDEIARFSAWAVENVNASIVPNDEGSDDGILWNFLRLLKGDRRAWDDLSGEQQAEIERQNSTTT